MWFKNLRVYEFEENFAYEPEAIAEKLEGYAFKPCSNVIPVSHGWAPPLDIPEAPLVYAGMGCMMLCLKAQEKIIPPAALRDLLQERIATVEARDGRKVYGKEKQRIREDIYHTMLSQAFCKSEKIYAYIDTVHQWLLIDAASEAKVEVFLAALRKALGNLKIKRPDILSPSLMMTKWLKERCKLDAFVIEDSCVLVEEDEQGGTVRCSRQDLYADRIHRFVNEGALVQQLSLSWQDQVKFMMTTDGSLKSLKFLDAVKEQVDDSMTETVAERFDTDFVIMSETLRAMLLSLWELIADKPKTAAKTPALAEA